MSPENLNDDTILTKALDVFSHYGYRKTSLDEVAAAVGVSRQTIYQRFKSKQNLFVQAVVNLLESTLHNATLMLNDETLSIEDKILKAFDALVSYFVKTMKNSPHIDEIISATNEHVGDAILTKQTEFKKQLAKTLTKSGIAKQYKSHGISSEDLSDMLYYTQKGVIYLCDSYEGFLEEMKKAIKIVCKGGKT